MRTTGLVGGSLPWVRALGGLVTVALLAACGSSASSASTSAASPSPTTAQPTTRGPVTPAQLATTLLAGANTVTSAHITLSSSYGSEEVLGAEGDERMAAGKLTAMRLEENFGPTRLTLMLVDKVVYVKMPANVVTNGKPWVNATEASTNPGLKKLAAAVSSLEKSTSLHQFSDYTQAAGSLKTIAVLEQLDGVAVAHYSMLVDVTKLHNEALTDAMKKGLAQAGISRMPVDLWVDEQGRTVKMAERFEVQGKTMAVDMTLTRINQPVSIVAPPASLTSGQSELRS
jgi:hypothetical protein